MAIQIVDKSVNRAESRRPLPELRKPKRFGCLFYLAVLAVLFYVAIGSRLDGATAIVLFTDGSDSFNNISLQSVLAAAKRRDMPTRARENTKLFIDRAHAGKELELIEKEIAKSKLKQLAHDIAQLNPTQ